jgi:L-rhamnose mutarotase
MSDTVAFRMRLNDGAQADYKARHDAIWPELAALLTEAGISDYRIFLHEPTLSLFAVLTRAPDNRIADLANHPIMRRWWAHMADLMATGPDGAPIVEDMPLMFHLA